MTPGFWLFLRRQLYGEDMASSSLLEAVNRGLGPYTVYSSSVRYRRKDREGYGGVEDARVASRALVSVRQILRSLTIRLQRATYKR